MELLVRPHKCTRAVIICKANVDQSLTGPRINSYNSLAHKLKISCSFISSSARLVRYAAGFMQNSPHESINRRRFSKKSVRR
jgi:hypothetical protein